MVPFITYYVIYQLQSIGFDQTEKYILQLRGRFRGSYKMLGESDSSHSLCSIRKTKRARVITTTITAFDDC